MATYEDHVDYTIRAWLQEPIHLPEGGRATVAQRIRETPQQRHWWPVLPARRSQAMVSAVKFAAATVLLAVFGGLVLTGFLTMPSDPGSAPGPVPSTPAGESVSPRPAGQPELPPDVASQVEALEALMPDGWELPQVVLEALAEGRIGAARGAIGVATNVLEDLIEADRLLPEVDLLLLVRPLWEAARTTEELEDATGWVGSLLEGVSPSVGPLGELSEALPVGWTFPLVVNDALANQRFDDVPVAVRAATDTVLALVQADSEAPDEGVLEMYRVRYESAATIEALQVLAEEAAALTDPAPPSPSTAPSIRR